MLEQIQQSLDSTRAARNAAAKLEKVFAEKTEMALTAPQLFVLFALYNASGPLTMGGLSEEMACSRGNVTGVVDRLEALNLLARQRSTEDRREVGVALTIYGAELMKKALA